MKLYKTKNGIIIESKDGFFEAEHIKDWDSLSMMIIFLKKLNRLINHSGDAMITRLY